MFKILHKKLLFIILLCCSSLIHAAVFNDDDPTSYVGTTGKGKYSKSITPNSAFSVLGEAGPRNFRLGGTLGWLIRENQRFKVSAEFLRQDIEYAFFTGDTREWVKQGAVGAQYQYDLFQYQYLPQLNLKAGYSHAPSKQLYSIAIPFLNGVGTIQNITYDRRIAGSDAGFVSPGISIQPWVAGRVGVELNYDAVHYDRIYAAQVHADGFGGSAYLNQQLAPNTELGLSAGIREPFNYYQANIAYTLPTHPDWTLGVDANYVDGKEYLPNTYNVGISISYAMKEVFVDPLEKDPIIRPANNVSTRWVEDPAIYLPQVLAISDARIITPPPPPAICVAPSLIGTIPTQTTTTTLILPTASVFSGTTPFTYSVTFSPVVGATTVTIDPTTGVLTITPGPTGTNYTFNVTVTATNSCGSVSTTFVVSAPFDRPPV